MSLYDSKIIRDLVHDYINPGKFELEKIVDTPHFQRLKDIRQLTCQHVYPNARHTRFEHSLGVYELTKRAIRYINRNGFIDNQSIDSSTPIISGKYQFNTQIAALLHDVGHCPFSHMGELQINHNDIAINLKETMEQINKEKPNTFSEEVLTIVDAYREKDTPANHEMLSCIVVLKHYYQTLSCIPTIELSFSFEEAEENDFSADFELIIRCILGEQYAVNENEPETRNDKLIKNLCIRLISDSAFDMDKLDYIMRDALYTGIGTPRIDTKRLFRAMKIDKNFKIVFTSKAVPALQSIIESRDSLYLWVYNHHTVVYSDFIYNYIFRRLGRNAERVIKYNKLFTSTMNICGCVSNNLIFSVNSVCEELYSDGDVQSVLNSQYRYYTRIIKINNSQNPSIKNNKIAIDEFEKLNIKEVFGDDVHRLIKIDETQSISNEQKEILRKILKVLNLVGNFINRKFLKPWWKTVFEYNNFMHRNFPDDIIRETIARWVCDGENQLKADEFRAQIAKHVRKIIQKLDNTSIQIDEGDFFIVERSNKFYHLDTIEKYVIYLKENEVIGKPNDTDANANAYNTHYYGKYLTKLLPQRDYGSMFQSYSFYIYVREYEEKMSENATEIIRQNNAKKYYKTIENVFVFVAQEFFHRGKEDFIHRFQPTKFNADTQFDMEEEEEKSVNEMLDRFKEQFENTL